MLDSCNVVIMESFYNDIVVGELNDDSGSSNFRDMNKDHESYLSHWLWKKRKIFSDASTLVVLTFLSQDEEIFWKNGENISVC